MFFFLGVPPLTRGDVFKALNKSDPNNTEQKEIKPANLIILTDQDKEKKLFP